MYSFSRIARAEQGPPTASNLLTEPVREESEVRSERVATDANDRDLLLAGEDVTLELAWPEYTADLEPDPEATNIALAASEPSTPPAESQAAIERESPGAPSIAWETAQDQDQILHGRYRLERAVAVGGSSIVYCATDLTAQREGSLPARVALKIVRPDIRHRAPLSERLKREFGYTASLHHPNIARVIDLDAHEGIPFFTMEYLEGVPLHLRLQRREHRPLAPAEALRILHACGAALAYAHDRGVLHCDFKPSNVFMTVDGQVKVLDFGAACAFTSALGASTKKPESATPAYASPQLLAAECPDVRDDVFSLGCVAYELFTGHHPFHGLSAVEMYSRGNSLDRPDFLTETRWRAIESALQTEREARPASVSAFLAAFSPPVATAATPAPVQRHAIAAALLLASGVVIGSWLQHRSVRIEQPNGTSAPVDVHSIEQAIAGYRKSLPNSMLSNLSQSPSAPLSTATKLSVRSFAPAHRPGTANNTHHESPATAKPLAEGMVTLEQSRVEVSGRSIAAVLTLRRTGTPTGRVSVQWRTQGGSARPSQDYESIADGVASLADGQSMRALFIPLKQRAGAQGLRSFTVEIKDAKGAQLGGITRAVVTIK